jgi:hypothetical protein
MALRKLEKRFVQDALESGLDTVVDEDFADIEDEQFHVLHKALVAAATALSAYVQ